MTNLGAFVIPPRQSLTTKRDWPASMMINSPAAVFKSLFENSGARQPLGHQPDRCDVDQRFGGICDTLMIVRPKPALDWRIQPAPQMVANLKTALLKLQNRRPS